MFRSDESAAGRCFAPGPSPALARRKTPYFAGPRPQSTARGKVSGYVEVRPSHQWFPVLQQPAASGTSFQTKKLVLHSQAPSRSSSLSSTLVLGRSSSVSQQPKSCIVHAPFSHSTNNSFSSAHFLRLRSKVSRCCGLCLYSCSSRLSGCAVQSTSAAHSAPAGRSVPLITVGLIISFFKADAETVSNQG